jgi:hypothetical protein
MNGNEAVWTLDLVKRVLADGSARDHHVCVIPEYDRVI